MVVLLPLPTGPGEPVVQCAHLMLMIWPSLMNVGPSFSRLSTASRASSAWRSTRRPVSTALASLVSQGAAAPAHGGEPWRTSEGQESKPKQHTKKDRGEALPVVTPHTPSTNKADNPHRGWVYLPEQQVCLTS